MTRLKLRKSLLARIKSWVAFTGPNRRPSGPPIKTQPLPSSKLISEIFEPEALPDHAAASPPDREP